MFELCFSWSKMVQFDFTSRGFLNDLVVGTTCIASSLELRRRFLTMELLPLVPNVSFRVLFNSGGNMVVLLTDLFTDFLGTGFRFSLKMSSSRGLLIPIDLAIWSICRKIKEKKFNKNRKTLQIILSIRNKNKILKYKVSRSFQRNL